MSKGKGDGSLADLNQIATGNISPSNLPVFVHGDFNGDGKQDIIAMSSFSNPDIAVMVANNSTSSSDIAIYYGDGAGKFSAPVTVTTLKNVYSYMRIADLDGDGRSDLILGNNSFTEEPDVHCNPRA